MSHVTLASLLTEFGEGGATEPRVIKPAVAADADNRASIVSEFCSLPEAGTSALEDAYSRGFDEGRRVAEANLAHDIGELRAAFDLKLSQARKAWAGEQGQVLAAQLTAAVEDMHHQLADCFSDVLLPILRDEVRSEAVRRISVAVRQTVFSDWPGPIIVEGPDDLIASFCGNLDDLASIIECRPTAGPDIKVTLNDTVIETQLAAWRDGLARVLS